MSKFDECVALYKQELTQLNIKVDEALLTAVTKALGPAIYNADASKVSSSDPEELSRVKHNFLIKKLGMENTQALDSAIEKVISILGSSNRNKYRAMVHYLLVIELGKESFFA